MPIEGVVADANVLLSAVVGKAALRVISASDVVVHVAQFNADELAEYLPLKHCGQSHQEMAETFPASLVQW